jgi:hypothetical protein
MNKETDGHTHRGTHKKQTKTDIQIGMWTYRQMNVQINGQTNRQVDVQTDRQIDRQIDMQINRHAGRRTYKQLGIRWTYREIDVPDMHVYRQT